MNKQFNLDCTDKVLVINAGSSSIKFQLFKVIKQKLSLLCKGATEGINATKGKFSYVFAKKPVKQDCSFPNHKIAIQKILQTILDVGAIQKLQDVGVIGHRIVHGGTLFQEPTIVNEKILIQLDKIRHLAPLHIPANLLAIKEFMHQTTAINVAVFDTAFHAKIPLLNFIYPLPWSWYQDYGVRKYGFHGISYQYLVERVSRILDVDVDKTNGIICHLGNGSSISAIKNGVGFDTSMGLTPLAGLMMGTRSGDVDPSVFQYMHRQKGLTLEQITDHLNSKSGFLGISQISYDLKQIEVAYLRGDPQAILAVDLFVKRVVEYIVVYFNALNTKVNYLIFSGGIGENSTLIVNKVLQKLHSLSLSSYQLPQTTHWKKASDHCLITDCPFPVLLVKTNEELVIAQTAIKLLKNI